MTALLVKTLHGLFKRWITLSTPINHYPVDSLVYFVDIYPLDSDLSSHSVIHLSNNWGLVLKGNLSLLML